jgi:hypothetical protein
MEWRNTKGNSSGKWRPDAGNRGKCFYGSKSVGLFGPCSTDTEEAKSTSLTDPGPGQRVGQIHPQTNFKLSLKPPHHNRLVTDVPCPTGNECPLHATSRNRRPVHLAVCMVVRNSALLRDFSKCVMSSSIASTGESGLSTRRSTKMRCRSSFAISSSSLRVPER